MTFLGSGVEIYRNLYLFSFFSEFYFISHCRLFCWENTGKNSLRQSWSLKGLCDILSTRERNQSTCNTLLSFTVFSSQQFKLTNTILTVGSPGAFSILTLKAPETKEGFSSTPSEVHLSANHCNCGRICLHEFLLSAVRTMLMCYALL